MSMAEIAKLINVLSIVISGLEVEIGEWLMAKWRKLITEKWLDGFQFELGILYIVVEGQGRVPFHNEDIVILWFSPRVGLTV